MSVQISAELAVHKFRRAEYVPGEHSWLVEMGRIIIPSLLVAISAHVVVPLGLTPVPFTLQTFAVILIGLTMGSRRSFAALLLYVAEGAAGLPVFSPHGGGGLVQLMGPTGGYLMALPVAAFVAGYATEQWHPKEQRLSRMIDILFGAISAEIVIFAGGALWLAKLTHLPAPNIFNIAVFPFLPGEIVKVIGACTLALRWKQFPKN